MIIAIDGPAASGKGTLGSRLARHYGFRHLDTGLLYRAVAKALIDAGTSPQDKNAAVKAARALDHAHLDRHALQSDAIGTAASIVSAVPEVRAVLLEYQRAFAAKPPGAVLDGRDIGTVIAPQAEVKIFLVAAAEEDRRIIRHPRLLDMPTGGNRLKQSVVDGTTGPDSVQEEMVALDERNPLVFLLANGTATADSVPVVVGPDPFGRWK